MNNDLIASIFSRPIKDPVPVFLMILGIMLVAPLLFEKIRLPGIVGLILAGVVVGPNGLGLLARDNTIVLLGTVGLLFLMFMAGLETSLDDLKYKVRGNFVRQVSRLLKTNDLLLFNGTVENKNQLLSLFDNAPDAIARNYPKVAMIIAYFPQ